MLKESEHIIYLFWNKRLNIQNFRSLPGAKKLSDIITPEREIYIGYYCTNYLNLTIGMYVLIKEEIKILKNKKNYNIENIKNHIQAVKTWERHNCFGWSVHV